MRIRRRRRPEAHALGAIGVIRIETGGLLEGTRRFLEPSLLLEGFGQGQVRFRQTGCLCQRGPREALRRLGSSRSPGRLGPMEIEYIAPAVEGLEHRERFLRTTRRHQPNRHL